MTRTDALRSIAIIASEAGSEAIAHDLLEAQSTDDLRDLIDDLACQLSLRRECQSRLESFRVTCYQALALGEPEPFQKFDRRYAPKGGRP